MKRDVVVVGGGLSGLAAAYTLEQQHIAYTLIEVRRRLGGSIQTLRQGGAALDGAGFAATPDVLAHPLLAALGLADAAFPLAGGAAVAFADGTEVLIAALAARLTAPRLLRMAVSSIGELGGGRFGVCLENGVLLDARALILAVPARYAERFFYGYLAPVAERLMAFQYAPLVRASLVLSADAALPVLPQVAFTHTTQHPARVAAGQQMVQWGIWHEGDVTPLAALLAAQGYGAAYLHTWPEADAAYAPDHAAQVAAVQALLPPGIALIGSDYTLSPPPLGLAALGDRLEQGVRAAQQVLATL